jgi:hypothetical protein
MATPALPANSRLAPMWLHRLHLLTDAEAGQLGLPDECIKCFVLDQFDMLVPRAAEFMDAVRRVFRTRRALAGSSTAGRTLVRSRQFTAACLTRLLSTPRACTVSVETWLYAALRRGRAAGAVDGVGRPTLGLVVALLVGDPESITARMRFPGHRGSVVHPASQPATDEWERAMHDVVATAGGFGPTTKDLLCTEAVMHVNRRTREMIVALIEAIRKVQLHNAQLQQQLAQPLDPE